MMGLSTTIYWVSWFVKCLLYMIPVVVVFTILLCIPVGEKGKVINYTQPVLIGLFLLFYVIATITFVFMVSTFFRKGKSINPFILIKIHSHHCVLTLVCITKQAELRLSWLHPEHEISSGETI